MRTSTMALLTIGLLPATVSAAPATPNHQKVSAAVSRARATLRALPRPALRYPSGNEEWVGWNVKGKAGKPLPLDEVLAQNLFFGYRDVYRRDPKDPSGKFKAVGRHGGALFWVERGADKLGRAVHDSPVFPKIYDALGL